MTVGSPTKRILNFTAPIFIGNIFQQFYSMADTIIVGKFVGNAALAAVGACGTLMFLILGFLQGMTAGFTVVTAQHYGAGNQKAMRRSVASAAVLSAVVSVVLTAVSMAMMEQILHWMNTPEDIPLPPRVWLRGRRTPVLWCFLRNPDFAQGCSCAGREMFRCGIPARESVFRPEIRVSGNAQRCGQTLVPCGIHEKIH